MTACRRVDRIRSIARCDSRKWSAVTAPQFRLAGGGWYGRLQKTATRAKPRDGGRAPCREAADAPARPHKATRHPPASNRSVRQPDDRPLAGPLQSTICRHDRQARDATPTHCDRRRLSVTSSAEPRPRGPAVASARQDGVLIVDRERPGRGRGGSAGQAAAPRCCRWPIPCGNRVLSSRRTAAAMVLTHTACRRKPRAASMPVLGVGGSGAGGQSGGVQCSGCRLEWR